jgi:glyoxylase-like metal-dependent hydrolase (beta-lactamase superfamily II)
MSEFIIIQLETGGFDHNFSYIVSEKKTGETVIIDPCGNTAIIENALLKFKKYFPKIILATHGHLDHISGVDKIKKSFNAPVAAHPLANFAREKSLGNGEKIYLGDMFIECIYSPGHTADSVVYHLSDDSAIFTGDTLFIDCIGYCNAGKMFETLQKIKTLADSNMVYSGHNYGNVPARPLGEEKKTNPYLSCDSFENFKKLLNEL